jgi:hypothetical protein
MAKFSDVITDRARLVGKSGAIAYCHTAAMFRFLCERHGITPLRKVRGEAIYDLQAIDRAIDRENAQGEGQREKGASDAN